MEIINKSRTILKEKEDSLLVKFVNRYNNGRTETRYEIWFNRAKFEQDIRTDENDFKTYIFYSINFTSDQKMLEIYESKTIMETKNSF